MEFTKLIFDNMDMIIITIGSIVVAAVIKCIGYKVLKKGQNVVTTANNVPLCIDVDNPDNVQWKKIGRVDDLIIYPVKSSEQPVRYDSFAFCDYGMCRQEYGTYFWDGMFLVYNKTKGKFEDSERYRFLRSVTADLTNTGEVTLSSHRVLNKVKLDIDRYRNPSNRFVRKTWLGTLETFYGSNLHTNKWIKEVLNANEIAEPNEFDKTKEDITLAQLFPRNWNSTQKIKKNWNRFCQEYKNMEFKNKTEKFLTLPRFVLMTSKTFVKLDTKHSFLTPNIIVETDKLMNPFEEKNWKWIKIGDNVILRNVKPVLRYPFDEQFQHFGIYCALWNGGNVKLYDKSNAMNMLMSGIAIMAAVFVGYKVQSMIKRNCRSRKRASEKGKTTLCCDVNKEYPTLNNLYWRKVGQVADLLIYPVNSSELPVFYPSFEFRDYGMCRREFETYFWNGMFSLYNKTKSKFEDNQRYPLLKLLRAQLTNTNEVTLRYNGISDTAIKLDIDQYRNPSNRFVKKTWNKTLKSFYGSNLHVNKWLKKIIDIHEINEDLILALMSPRKWDSTEEIKDNWCHFLRGYEAMEKKPGKLITLPRFVLMTTKTSITLKNAFETLMPNIVVDTDDESINPFEEQNWDWIKLGNDVVLKNVKPVPSFDKTIEHCGIYCGLWSGGNVKLRDEVYIYDPPRRQWYK